LIDIAEGLRCRVGGTGRQYSADNILQTL